MGLWKMDLKDILVQINPHKNIDMPFLDMFSLLTEEPFLGPQRNRN
jgi:hypothetical protein